MFLAQASGYLEAAEAEHNLFFGICDRLITRPELVESPLHLLTVDERDEVVGAAMQAGPRKWILSRAVPDAVAALVDFLRPRNWLVPGVVGPTAEAQAFAGRWRPGAFRRGKAQRIYELRGVIPPPRVRGRPRLATAPDVDLVAGWGRAFSIDALTDEGPDNDEQTVRRLLADGRLYVWEDGVPLSMTGVNRQTPNGAVIAPVYTPPEHRRCGFASALVAAVSDRMLAAGKRYCCLFTDLANPTSNAIYQQIGYRPVADWVDFLFD